MKMFYSSFALLGAISIFLAPNVSAFSCKINGVTVHCPTFSGDPDKDWCCDNYCCDFNEYTKHNSGPPTGMIVAFVVVSVIILTCGCCFIARRRAKERALLGLETEPITAVPNASYPHQVHPPPAPILYNQPPLPYEPPPPYEVAPPPYPAQQPHVNPYYRSEERKF